MAIIVSLAFRQLLAFRICSVHRQSSPHHSVCLCWYTLDRDVSSEYSGTQACTRKKLFHTGQHYSSTSHARKPRMRSEELWLNETEPHGTPPTVDTQQWKTHVLYLADSKEIYTSRHSKDALVLQSPKERLSPSLRAFLPDASRESTSAKSLKFTDTREIGSPGTFKSARKSLKEKKGQFSFTEKDAKDFLKNKPILSVEIKLDNQWTGSAVCRRPRLLLFQSFFGSH
ncbi:hypothetical protein ACLOJK_008693 [Asimina triloba]